MRIDDCYMDVLAIVNEELKSKRAVSESRIVGLLRQRWEADEYAYHWMARGIMEEFEPSPEEGLREVREELARRG